MANSFYMDASALAKRYVPEKGSAQIDAILDHVPSNRIRLLNIGAGEVVSDPRLILSLLSLLAWHGLRRRHQLATFPGTREAFVCQRRDSV